MYALYKKTRLKGHCRYEFKERASLFGCNQGYIPWLLAKQMSPSQKEPYGWHLRLEEALAKADCPDSTLIIDLKPKQQKTNLSLYEVLDVWGWSASGWTPILLHLCGLLVDADPKGVDRNDFRIRNDERDEPIYAASGLSVGNPNMLWLPGKVEATLPMFHLSQGGGGHGQ